MKHPLIYKGDKASDPQLKGKHCRLLLQSKPKPRKTTSYYWQNPWTGGLFVKNTICAPWNCAIEFEDGTIIITKNSEKILRKAYKTEQQVTFGF